MNPWVMSAAAAFGLTCGVLIGRELRTERVSAQSDGRAAEDWQRTKDCAAQAEHEFTAEGNRRGGIDLGRLVDFTSHYNRDLGKCFMFIESTDSKSAAGTVWESKNLSDAFEGKVYGEYAWPHTSPEKRDEPFSCFVISATGQKQNCKSADEFGSLVKAYMGKP